MSFGFGRAVKRSARFSPCKTWRYTLVREWEEGKRRLLFILLNPSTADAMKDDPTNRRGIDFARQWGFGSVVFVNLFAIRSPDPDLIQKVGDPIGPENGLHIANEVNEANTVVCAWGNKGHFLHQDKKIISHLLHSRHDKIFCLGRNGDGSPEHPLYIPRNRELREFEPPY